MVCYFDLKDGFGLRIFQEFVELNYQNVLTETISKEDVISDIEENKNINETDKKVLLSSKWTGIKTYIQDHYIIKEKYLNENNNDEKATKKLSLTTIASPLARIFSLSQLSQKHSTCPITFQNNDDNENNDHYVQQMPNKTEEKIMKNG